MSAWSWMLAALAAVVITAFVVTTWLLTIAGHAEPGTDRANSRLDAVRTGLATGAGAGAAVGLMLAFRRQHHQEVATDLTNRDATERRITELYTNAVEQLGNDRAPVRLGGFYALERLAQDNPAHRQMIVNIISAYLRMPFSPTSPASRSESEATGDPQEPGAETKTRGIDDTWQQERQVRLTAQRILAEHLRDDRTTEQRATHPTSPRFWPDIRLDLTGATLIDFNLRSSVSANANFSGATFTGDADFNNATFIGDASFEKATFAGSAWFHKATFTSDASFEKATFAGSAWFHEATFTSDAKFNQTTFTSSALFYQGTFSRLTLFGEVTFGGGANFNLTIFNGLTLFHEVTFTGEHGLSFAGSVVGFPSIEHAWPMGWRLRSDDSGGYTIVRAKT